MLTTSQNMLLPWKGLNISLQVTTWDLACRCCGGQSTWTLICCISISNRSFTIDMRGSGFHLMHHFPRRTIDVNWSWHWFMGWRITSKCMLLVITLPWELCARLLKLSLEQLKVNSFFFVCWKSFKFHRESQIQFTNCWWLWTQLYPQKLTFMARNPFTTSSTECKHTPQILRSGSFPDSTWFRRTWYQC